MGEPVSRVQGYFDAAATEYVLERESQFSFQSQKALALRMLEGAALRPGSRALDIGCGPALMEPALLERGLEVWGVDVSARMIEAGRARVTGHARHRACHLNVGDAERLDFPSAFFDAVLCMGVLEYLADYRPALREIHRVLKPGGTAVLTVPSGVSPYHLAHGLYRLLRKGKSLSPTVKRCVPARLDRLCEETGLRKLEGRGCNFIFFPLHDKWPGASLALNRRLAPLAESGLGVLLGAQYVVNLQKRAVR